MVFYGKKLNNSDQNNEDYRSIKQQILKQLGDRITPVQQTNLASIFFSMGNAILTIPHILKDIPEMMKGGDLQQLGDLFREDIKQAAEPLKKKYQTIPQNITKNKIYILNNYTFQQRILFLNASLALIGAFSISRNIHFFPKIRGLLKTFVVGYPLGSLLIVPEFYNSIISKENL